MDIILEILIAFGLVLLFMVFIAVIPRHLRKKKLARTQLAPTKNDEVEGT
jgi:cbb3-type cytochrome oxidase subunit 3